MQRLISRILLTICVILTGVLSAHHGYIAGYVWADECPDVELIFARGTTEPEGLGKVGTGLLHALQRRVSGTITGYGVEYPANYNFVRAAEGANDVSNRVDYMIEHCPETRLVLGGYSQGAAVIDIIAAIPVPGFGFTDPLPSHAPDHIAAIAVFGNPSAKLGQPLTHSLTYGSRTIDLCMTGDPICSDGNNPSAHTRYVPAMTNRAAEFIAQQLS